MTRRKLAECCNLNLCRECRKCPCFARFYEYAPTICQECVNDNVGERRLNKRIFKIVSDAGASQLTISIDQTHIFSEKYRQCVIENNQNLFKIAVLRIGRIVLGTYIFRSSDISEDLLQKCLFCYEMFDSEIRRFAQEYETRTKSRFPIQLMNACFLACSEEDKTSILIFILKRISKW